MAEATAPSFLEFLQSADWRFLQERRLGIDLYNSGYLGVAVAGLVVASSTVFVLALFQVIPKRRHIVTLLVGLGVLSCGLGLLVCWWNFDALPTSADRIVHTSAGPAPVTMGQQAAVVALPLLIGVANLTANVLGCLYLAIFWSGRFLPGKRRAAKARSAQTA